MKIPEELKRKFKFKPKNEKGSVTLFVLIAMLFFLTVGVIIFITNMNNSTSQQKDYNKIQKDYNNVANGNLDTIYDEQEAKVTNKIQIIVRDADGNVYKEGDWTNNIPLSVEVIWPKEIQSNSGSSNKKQIAIMHGISTTTYTDSQISSLNIVDDGTYNIFAQINDNKAQLTVKVDSTAPSVTISPNGDKTYINPTTRKLLDTIEITAEDSLSGVKSVEYIISKNEQTPTKDNENWKTYSEIDEIPNAQNGEIYYVYAKVTDNVGNVDIIKSNPYEIVEARATFMPGTDVNVKMKTLAGNTGTVTHDTEDELISKIELSSSIPSEYRTDANKVSTADSKLPIYMWAVDDPDNTGKKIIKWFTDDPHPYMNEIANNMFRQLTKLETIPELNIIDTSKARAMGYIFYRDMSLTELDVSKFDTSKVTSFRNTFNGCSGLTSLDVSKFDTSNVTEMFGMFFNCSNLTSLDVSEFNTSKVTSMLEMFYNCNKLTSLDVSKFDTNKVTSMQLMFAYCSGLTNIDVSHFDTSNVTSMRSMFHNCSGLTELDLSSFDTSKVTSMWHMFNACSNLTTIYASDKFVTTALTNEAIEDKPEGNNNNTHLFDGCSKLVGGSGTPYSAEHVNADYARIDGLNGLAGYFTNHYFIEFNANTENAQGEMTNQGIPFSYATNLKENGFTKEGYIFRGWATSPNGPVVYENGASMNYDLDGIKAVVTDAQDKADDKNVTLKLYAVWSVKHYEVTYGSPAITKPAETLVEAMSLAQDNATIKVTLGFEDTSVTDANNAAQGVLINKNITLDTNGQNLTMANTITVAANNTVTFVDTAETKGKLERTAGDLITNDGTVIVGIENAQTGPTLTSRDCVIAGGNVTVNNGNINGLTKLNRSFNAAIYAKDVVINNGSITSQGNYGIVTYSNGTCTLNGGTVNGYGAICPQNGRIIINEGANVIGNEFAIGNSANWHNYTLEINGGEISALGGNAIKAYANNTNIIIKSGKIIGYTYGINSTGANSVIKIGNSATAFNQTTPSIKGEQYSIAVSGSGSTLEYYDGKLIGKTHDKTYDGREVTFNVAEANVTPRTGYKPYTRQNGDYYETVLEKEITVTAEAGDGTISATDGWTIAQDGKTATKKVLQNTPYGTLPTKDEMERTGYTFKGWNGKNLFNKETTQDKYEISGTSIVANNSWFVTDFIEVTPGEKYTISGKTQGVAILYYDQNKQNGTRSQDAISGTITIPSGKKYIRLNGLLSEKNTLQIEDGSTATAYEPYYITDNTTVVRDDAHTLNAVWEANDYLLTADANGGTIPSTTGWTGTGETSIKTVKYDSQYGALPTPTRTGYTFDGWYKPKYDNYGYKNTFNSNKTIRVSPLNVWSSNTELLKEGDIIEYDVTVDGTTIVGADINDKTIDSNNYTNTGTNIKGKIVITNSMLGRHGNPSVVYYHFLDVNCEGTPTSYTINKFTLTQFDNESKVETDTIYKTAGNSTIYAKWTAITYNITYNMDGGTNNAANPATYTIETPTINLQAPTKSNSTFFGWSVNEGNSALGRIVYQDQNTTIDNGTYTFTNTTEGNRYSYSKIQLLEPTAYKFIHTIKTKAGTGKVYGIYDHKLESGIYAIHFGTNGNKRDTYVDYALNLEQGKKYYYEWENIQATEQEYIAKDFKFVEATGNTTASIPQGSYGDKTFTAYWYANQYTYKEYTATFNVNGGNELAEADKTITLQYGTALGTLPTPTRTGYDFAGWYTAATGGTQITAATKMGAANVTYYAHWTAKKYILTANANGGSIPETSGWTGTGTTATKSVTYDANYGALPVPTRTGYTFKGWYKEEAFTNAVTDSTKVTTASNHTIYAKWEANPYTVTANANGGSIPETSGWTGTGATVTKSVTYDANYGALPAPTRTGYAFKGWYKEQAYTNAVTDSTKVTTASNHTIYAKWEANKYTVVFNKNADSATGTMANQEFTYDQAQNLTENGFIRPGYTFAGWATTSTGTVAHTDKKSVSNLTATNNGTVNLYAKWTATPYTVTLNAGEGTVNEATGWTRAADNKTATKDITYDGAYGTLPTASRPGYNFDGWFTEATGGTEVKADTIMQTAGTVTLYPHWTARTDTPYKVKHYKQNIDGTYPSTPADTDNLKGTTDTSVTPARKTYEGFDSPAGAALTIKGEGTAVLEYKYTRKSYTVTYNYSENGGTTATKTTDTKKYEAPIDLTPTATKSGYDFVGWNTDKDAHVALTSKNMPAENVTLYAIYKKDIKITTYQYKNAKTENTATLYNKDANVSVTLPTIADKKVGDITYTARGWSEANTANGAIAANSGATVQLNASKTYYASYQKEMTATFNYWNGTAAATATASAIRYMNYNEAYVQSTITTPEVVTGSTGKESTTFTHVSSTKNGTAATVNTATLTYYAVYSKTVKATLKTYNDQSTEKSGTAYAYYDGTTVNAEIALGTTGNATNSSVVYEPRHWSTSDSADASSSVALNGTASIINDTTYYASYKKDFEATFNYWNGTAKASKKETKTRFMNYKGTLKQTNYDIPAEAKANAGDYTYKHITTGTATTSTAVTPSTANATYYTVYTRTLTVEYDGNGSTSGTTASQTATQTMNANGAVSSHNFTLQANGFSKTGYTFNKWALGSASGTQYAAGATYTFAPAQGASKNVKFFANWTANSYTIAFNGNGSTGGTTASQNATYDQDITLNENGFTRAYKVKYNVNGGNAIADATATYTFAGWKLNNTGDLIENKATVKNLATTGTATLYAQWNAGSVTLPNATRTGYTFAGWFKDEELTQSAGAVGSALTPTAETTLYAKWTANPYTVTANANGGTIGTATGWNKASGNATATKTINYDSAYGTLPEVSRTGYTFKGWKINGEGDFITDQSKVKTASNHTIKAIWEANKYTVVFNKNADNATGTMEPQEFTYDKAQNLTANGFSRTGYSFAGWATTTSGAVVHTDGKSVSNLTATANGTVNLYAKWNPKKLTINYNKNDGTTTKSTETFTYDGNMNDNYFAPNDDLQYRDNYVFKGWSFKTDGSDNVRYAFKDKVGETWFINQVGTAEEKTINLYAIWESANYSVSVSGNKTYYYLTLKDAVDKADASGSTITFLQTGFTDSTALTIGKNITINTNGKTVTMSNGITVSSGKTVTFTGSGTIKKTSGDLITNSGTVVVNGPNLEAGAITINGGNVTVTAGTVKGGTNAISTTGANTVTIGTSGGTVSTTAPVITGINGSAIVMSSTSSTFNFYDGKIAGKTTATVRGVSTSYDVKGTVNYPTNYGAHTAQNSSNGNLYETILVEVTVNVSPTTMYLNLNNNTTGTITVSGSNYGTIEYSSTDPTVATVNSSTGAVTAVKSGTTTIKVKDKNSGVEKTITVIIDALSPTWTITVKSIT